jgi:REase_DpnII-MboI
MAWTVGDLRYTRSMDFETLYNMAASAARNAERMCSQEGGPAHGLPFQNYAGYPAYIDEYNRLVALTSRLDPEVATFIPLVDLQKGRNQADVPGYMWKSNAELAAVRLSTLASYLKSKLGTKEQEHEQIIDIINGNLRAAIYEDPEREREVQNALETIFRARTLDFRREQVTVPYSTKRYIPDFTFDRIGLAVEVKLCKDKDREKLMIDEINADIKGYGGRYERIIFVVYDLGFIRDVARFSGDIEKSPGVHVLIVKK